MGENIMNGNGLWNVRERKTGQECRSAGRGLTAQWVLMTAGVIIGAFLLIGAMVAPLCAQSYPDHPIRFILPFAPGGGADILGRLMAPKLEERLGQPVVCENHGGAGGNVGFDLVAKARPDGYTILLAGTSFAISRGLYKQLNYDAIKDFEAISMAGQITNLVLVNPSLPVKTLKEFVEYAKARPGKLNFTSGGVGTGTHLATELLMSLTGIKMVHVSYKGAGPALVGLISGEADMMVLGIAQSKEQIQAGKVRALAVLDKERLPALPDVPTAKEAGIDNYEVSAWYGMFAPAGTPRDIVKRFNSEWVRIAAMPDTIEKIRNSGVEPISDTPEECSAFLKAEIARWTKVIKEANIPLVD